jgi:5-methylcytosine-specific restriction endonuclease McrA
MPFKPRRVCACGAVVWFGELCACQQRRKAEADKRRPSATDRGYDSRWQKARAAFLQKHPDCIMCGKPAVVVDHIEPHRGDKAKFWNSRNWQPLCTHHHSSTKQSQERRQ